MAKIIDKGFKTPDDGIPFGQPFWTTALTRKITPEEVAKELEEQLALEEKERNEQGLM